MIPFLIVLLPLLGALSFFLFSETERRATLRRLLIGVIPVVQALLLAVSFFRLSERRAISGSTGGSAIPDLSERFFQPIGRIGVGSDAWSLSLLWGIDGFVLPFLFLLLILLAAAILFLSRRGEKSRYIWGGLLLLDCCAVGALVSHDGLSLLLFVGATLLGAVIAVGTGSKFERGDGREGGKNGSVGGASAARRFLPVASFVTLAMTCALLWSGLKTNVAAQNVEGRIHTLELPALADHAAGEFAASRAVGQRSEKGESSEQLFFVLLVSCSALLMMIVPFHPVVRSLGDSSSLFSRFVLLLFPLLGLYLLFRLPVLLFPGSALNAADLQRNVLEGIGGLTAIYGGAVALGERKPERILQSVVMAWSGIAFLCFASPRGVRIDIGIAALLLSGVAVAGLFILIDRVSYRIGKENMGDVRGLLRVVPGWSRLFGVQSVLLILLPVLLWGMLAFTGSDAALNQTSAPEPDRLDGGWMIGALLGGVAAAGAIVRMDVRLLFGTWPVALDTVRPSDLSGRVFYGGLIAVLLVAALSLAVAFGFTGFAEETIRQILENRVVIST